ncbi:mitochondrial translation initiation factor Mti3 [Schizosaccharomyces osmophilus]|uniref:Mitochondrial translation initiation factor Mti3 n=1 Tax=Schizosaccharomyces osmophilus TaxID=2545709 RepID=A0AAE9W9T0_9SCHI|nr:mitochondrial translation initiation factor Mti3 [Schizosaccharomyces osmophilus]WBW71950.1 mitochondrial translation initiation factor Mti3 [Schizosaccharomyces osmophilus]
MSMLRNLLFKRSITCGPSFITSQIPWPRLSCFRYFHSSFVSRTNLSESLKEYFKGRLNESIASEYVFMRMKEDGRPNKLTWCSLHQAISNARDMGDHAVLKVADRSENVEHPICVYAPIQLLENKQNEKAVQEDKIRRSKHKSKTRLRYILLSWRIDNNDLERKLKGAEKFLQSGIAVEIHVEGKKNTPPASPEQKQQIIAAITRLSRTAKESTPPSITKHSAIFNYQGVENN